MMRWNDSLQASIFMLLGFLIMGIVTVTKGWSGTDDTTYVCMFFLAAIYWRLSSIERTIKGNK